MNKIAIGGAVVLVVVLILGVKELFYMGDDTVKMHTAESLLMVRSQVEKALPADYPAENVMAAFDVALDKVTTGQIDAGEMIQHLKRISANLQDGQLDSVEIESVIIGFHKVMATK